MHPIFLVIIAAVLSSVLIFLFSFPPPGTFFGKFRSTKKTRTFLVMSGTVCFFVISIVAAELFYSIGEKTDVIKNERAETQRIMSLTQVGPKKYLLQNGIFFRYDACISGKRKSQEVPIKNVSVYYDTNDANAHIVIKETLVEHQTKFLFLSEKTTDTVEEYEIHIPSRNNIIFSFEKS